MFRPIYSKHFFFILRPYFDLYQSLIGCLVKIRNYSILSLAFIASSFKVTEENLVFETVQSAHTRLSNIFSALKGSHFFILIISRGPKSLLYKATDSSH